MIAAPYYLLAAGIVTLIVGLILAAAVRPPAALVHANMSDERIAQELERAESVPFGAWVVRAGLLMILSSIVWRLVRIFV